MALGEIEFGHAAIRKTILELRSKFSMVDYLKINYKVDMRYIAKIPSKRNGWIRKRHFKFDDSIVYAARMVLR